MKEKMSGFGASCSPADDREPAFRATLRERVRKLRRERRTHLAPHQVHRFDLPAVREDFQQLLPGHASFKANTSGNWPSETEDRA